MSDLYRRAHFSPLRSLPELRPLALAGSTWDWAAAGACGAGIAAVVVLEGHNSGLVSLGSLLFVPVLASAWFLGDRAAATISALALGARLVGYAIAGVDLGTAVAEVAALGFLAFMTRLGAVGLVEARERAARIEHDRRRLQTLQEREEIARRVTDTAIRGIFGMTLRLQAISNLLDDDEQKAAVRGVIADADAVSVEFRNSIFKPERTAPPD